MAGRQTTDGSKIPQRTLLVCTCGRCPEKDATEQIAYASTQADENSYCIPNGKDTRIATIENSTQLHPTSSTRHKAASRD